MSIYKILLLRFDLLALIMQDILMYYTPPNPPKFLSKLLKLFQLYAYVGEKSVDPDQLASQKPADLDLHIFQNGNVSKFGKVTYNKPDKSLNLYLSTFYLCGRGENLFG